MTLDELEVWMLEFICGQYHVRPHSTTKQRPDLARARHLWHREACRRRPPADHR
nr:hypothetical protein [Citrobacter portucalensis]